ncbi:hypothetical protein [Promicromonospora iranensis]|uniref:Uncharacterized protein n=1 Tax=Promicromonospora iranensis TaxID=1105144 RepID=A0ABU2CTW2_9MICO|nr:hypothetical protein [Promicromonospora iranensis]MDR7384786.1 hypothetical protein [Promicromonospora iranensis]
MIGDINAEEVDRVGSESKSDTDAVGDLLQGYFPDFRVAVEAFVRDHKDYADGLNTDWRTTVDAWAWVSELFIPEILRPALTEDRGDDLVQRISSFLEDLLVLHRPSIDDLLRARVIDHLLGYRELWQKLRPAAGPLLLELVSEQQQYYGRSL